MDPCGTPKLNKCVLRQLMIFGHAHYVAGARSADVAIRRGPTLRAHIVHLPLARVSFMMLLTGNLNDKRPKKHFKNEQRSKDAAAKKVLIQVEYIGKINNYYEDIYIPPYNNTD